MHWRLYCFPTASALAFDQYGQLSEQLEQESAMRERAETMATQVHTVYTCPGFFTALKGHATPTRVEALKISLVARIMCARAHTHAHTHTHSTVHTHFQWSQITHTSLGGSIHRRQPLEV